MKLNDVNQAYVNWLNDPEFNQYLETRYEVQTMDSVHKYVGKMIALDDELFFPIWLQDNGKHIGNIKLGPINPIHKIDEVSLFIGDKNYWGKNLATRAIGMLRDFAFKDLKLHKLTAGFYANNIGSIRAFQKNGFLIEGTWKKQYLCDGKYVDRICLGIISKIGVTKGEDI